MDEAVGLGRARAALEAAAERLLRIVHLLHGAAPAERDALASMVAQAQAEYDATRAALTEARTRLRARIAARGPLAVDADAE
jgi:hypothetical protein